MIKKVSLGVFVAILLAGFVVAYGVSSPYWLPDRPLKISPGKTVDMQLKLQNMIGDKNLTFSASIINGGEIASISDADATYSLPLGAKDVPVNIRVSIPKNYTIGGIHQIGLVFNVVQPSGGGMIQVGSAIETSFPVEVVEIPPVESSGFGLFFESYWWIILLVIVLLVVYYVWKRRKKSGQKRRKKSGQKRRKKSGQKHRK